MLMMIWMWICCVPLLRRSSWNESLETFFPFLLIKTAKHGYSLGSFPRSLNLQFVMVNYSNISKNCCDSLSWPMDTDLLYSWLHHRNSSNLSHHASKKPLFHFRLHKIMQTKCVPHRHGLVCLVIKHFSNNKFSKPFTI